MLKLFLGLSGWRLMTAKFVYQVTLGCTICWRSGRVHLRHSAAPSCLPHPNELNSRWQGSYDRACGSGALPTGVDRFRCREMAGAIVPLHFLRCHFVDCTFLPLSHDGWRLRDWQVLLTSHACLERPWIIEGRHYRVRFRLGTMTSTVLSLLTISPVIKSI